MTASEGSWFRLMAAGSAVLSAPVAYLAEVLGVVAIDFDPTAFSEPSTIIALGTEGATLIWWGMRLNLFGYYLLVAPAVVFLWYWLRPKDPPLVTLLTVAGLAYVLSGALAATINAVIWPDLMTQYARAGPDQQAVIETVFSPHAMTTVVVLWGILNRTMAAVWWVGIGALLRSERRWLGLFTLGLGAISAIAALGNLLDVAPLVGLGTMGYLLLAPLWALWLGVDLWRRPVESVGVETAEPAPRWVEGVKR